VNTQNGALDHSFAEGTVDVTRTLTGLPKAQFPGGQMTTTVSGTAKLWVDPANPAQAPEVGDTADTKS
jgi:hypothetical protein